MKRILAKFYMTRDGAEPFRDWLQSLDKGDRHIIGSDIAMVEFGWPIGMPTCRPVRDGVREVRSTIRNGRVEARTYFGIDDNIMLLLHGEEGKDRQKAAIELAIHRWKDHLQRTRRTKKLEKGKQA